ncbi:MAG: CBM20 domain-containing protein [Clostridia bacterium]|nr:CBM20 domain-containing protein [Clostridia bacterium]
MKIPVRFTVNGANTAWGQNVYLCGNTGELAYWSAAEAVGPLPCPNYPSWTITVDLPAGQTIEFKAIKKDADGKIVWEGGNNHVYTVPTSGNGNVQWTWAN